MLDFFTQLFEQIRKGLANELAVGFSSAIPKVAMAFFILFLGWLIARTLRRVIRRIVAGIGVDELASALNDIDLVQRSGMKVSLSGLLSGAVYYFLMLSFVIVATDVLGAASITALVRDVVNYMPSLLTAFALFIAGIFLAEAVRKIVHTALQSIGVPTAKMIASIVFYFLFITMAVSALAQAKVDTRFIASNITIVLAAGALAFALGYGMASRDLVANYLAGYYNRNKVRVGDEIRIIGVKGKVALIDATSLILQTEDKAIVVPLSKLTTEKVEVFYPDALDEGLLDAGPADTDHA